MTDYAYVMAVQDEQVLLAVATDGRIWARDRQTGELYELPLTPDDHRNVLGIMGHLAESLAPEEPEDSKGE